MAAPRELRGPIVAVALTGAILAASTATLLAPRAGASAGIGALVATGNLYALGRTVGATLGAEGGARAAAWRLLGALKQLLLLAVVWTVLARRLADPIPFVVGYGALPLGLVASSLLGWGRAKDAVGKVTPRDPPPPS